MKLLGWLRRLTMQALMTNIYLTDVCQRNCPSCYYTKNSTYMSYDVADRIARWIGQLCRIEDVKLYKAHFLGGEPFENEEVLFFLIDQIRKYLPSFTQGHPDGQFVVFTNGDLLGAATLQSCREHKLRILLNPTTDTILNIHEKMHLIKYICGGVSLAVVADSINLPRLPRLAQLAVDHNSHIRINRLYNGGNIPGYIEEFGKQMHNVFDILLAAETPMWPNYILESTYPMWNDNRVCHFCERCLLIFDPDGSIRSCNADLDTKIGHINTHQKMSDFTFQHKWSASNIKECDGCEWRAGGYCCGGCPYTRKLTYGDYNHRTPFCSIFKELFPRLKQLTDKYKRHYGLEF